MDKLLCMGEVDGMPIRWGRWGTVHKRPNGDLAVFDFFSGSGVMGFRSGGWAFRRRIGDYDVYDVDFGKRFHPRRGRKTP